MHWLPKKQIDDLMNIELPTQRFDTDITSNFENGQLRSSHSRTNNNKRLPMKPKTIFFLETDRGIENGNLRLVTEQSSGSQYARDIKLPTDCG